MEKKITKQPDFDRDRDDRINRKLAVMRHKDLQIECIVRGLSFQLAVDYDNPRLANFYYKNFEKEPIGGNILDEYDKWVDEQLEKRGYKKGDVIFDPCFRLGFTPDITTIEPKKPLESIRHSINIVGSKSKVLEEPKVKREKDEDMGIMKGTKKHLTYQLVEQGLPMDEIIKRVIEQFPEAKDKSIRIWINRAKNQ